MKCCASILLFFFFSLAPQQSAQQGIAEVSVVPDKATTNSLVQFECRLSSDGYAAVYFHLMRTDQAGKEMEVVRYDIRCTDGGVIKQQYSLPSGAIQPDSNCNMLKVASVTATRDAVAGRYRCKIEHFMADFKHTELWSKPVQFMVGDPTPVLSRFDLTDAATGALVPNDGQVTAGANVSVVCETPSVKPPPDFTVTIAGQQVPASGAAPVGTNRFFAYTLVPRSPRIVCRCEAFNGFGEKQSQEFGVDVQYGADRASVAIPEQATVQSAEEIEVCRVANNPPRRLRLSGLPDGALQEGYPRYEETTDGFSVAYIKLASAAEDLAKLDVNCGMPGEGGFEPVKKAVKLVGVEAVTTQGPSASSTASNNNTSISAQVSTPSSAMMTVGIVVAGVVVFIIVVAIVVCALKKRNANKTPNSDKPGYGKVNQNDVDAQHPTYEANTPGKPPIRIDNSV